MPVGVAISTLILPAYRVAGITQRAMIEPSTDMYDEAIPEFNRMIGQWNCERPKIFTIAINAFNLGAQKIYFVGSGATPGTVTIGGQVWSAGAFDMQRPQEIQNGIIGLGPAGANALVRMPPMQQLDDQAWAKIALQDIPGAVPLAFYYDGSYDTTTGFGLIYLWPQSASGYSVEWYVWNLLDTVALKTDLVALPPGYESAIVYNLAVRLAALNPNEANISPDSKELARVSLAAIERKNAVTPNMTTDYPSRGGLHYDYRIGMMR